MSSEKVAPSDESISRALSLLFEALLSWDQNRDDGSAADSMILQKIVGLLERHDAELSIAAKEKNHLRMQDVEGLRLAAIAPRIVRELRTADADGSTIDDALNAKLGQLLFDALHTAHNARDLALCTEAILHLRKRDVLRQQTNAGGQVAPTLSVDDAVTELLTFLGYRASTIRRFKPEEQSVGLSQARDRSQLLLERLLPLLFKGMGLSVLDPHKLAQLVANETAFSMTTLEPNQRVPPPGAPRIPEFSGRLLDLSDDDAMAGTRGR